MVLTAAQTTAFFTNATQMGIPQATVAAMEAEGISTVPDLVDFTEDTIRIMAKNLRSQDRVFGAKSEKRLIAAANMVRYYNTVGRELTAANMKWNEVGRNFEEQWSALKDRKDSNECCGLVVVVVVVWVQWVLGSCCCCCYCVGGWVDVIILLLLLVCGWVDVILLLLLLCGWVG